MIREPLGALAFMTRLPVPGVDWTIPLHRLSAWFPLVGLMVGGCTALSFTLGLLLGLPPVGAALLATAAELWLTGGLHPDGLADTADGLAGGSTERRLEIMKDPRLGSYGGIALFFTLAGRLVFLPALPAHLAITGVITAHVICRWPPVWALARYPYARPGGGTGAAFSGAGWREILIAGGTALALSSFLAGGRGLAAAIIAWAAGMLTISFAARKLGGVTGDVCGAATETALLVGLAVLTATPAW